MVAAIFTLAWPTMLQELMQTAVQYIDTAMVGALGTDATAAVGSTTTVNWLVSTSISALGIGFLSFVARSIGAGKRNDAARASAQSVFVVLVVGIFFTIITNSLSSFVPRLMQVDENIQDLAARYFLILYSPMLFRTAIIIFSTVLRAAGDTRTPMIVGVFVNIINVLLNFILIYPSRMIRIFSFDINLFGADLGIEGAALASAVAFAFGGIMITVKLFKHPLVSPKGYSIKPDVKILKPCLKVALPNMAQRFATSFGYVAFATMINSLGEISTAAHTIANTVESAFYIPGYGMQAAAATMAGNALGAKDRNKLQSLTRMIILIEVALMIITGGLLFIFAPWMMSLFTSDNSVILLGVIVLRMVAVSEPFYGVSIVVEGMLQGVGKTMAPFVINILGMWGIRIVGTYICTQLLSKGLVSAWGCMIAHNLLIFSLFLIYWLKIKKKIVK
ncbi:MAG: MATE family efflux transporter [Ruminococcaceae bacterium]|nr:MATE family efflux transporter [Oscillospiraceae bacterium]